VDRRAQPDAGNDQAVEHVADTMLEASTLINSSRLLTPFFDFFLPDYRWFFIKLPVFDLLDDFISQNFFSKISY